MNGLNMFMSMFSGGSVTYFSLFSIFTPIEVGVYATIVAFLLFKYVNMQRAELKKKQVEKDYKKLEVKKKCEAVEGVKNVNMNGLF